MARILYVPILHTEKEVSLTSGHAKRAEVIPALKEMWIGIQREILNLKPDWARVRLYQEALPVCGRERNIVTELSLKGSMNHRLLNVFLRRGAHLEGTEDMGLLVQEHHLLSKALGTEKGDRTLQEYRTESDRLLKKRDEFIASRIRQTLRAGETGLLFIGVRHKVDQILKGDFEIHYVIYRIPFGEVKTVYNL